MRFALIVAVLMSINIGMCYMIGRDTSKSREGEAMRTVLNDTKCKEVDSISSIRDDGGTAFSKHTVRCGDYAFYVKCFSKDGCMGDTSVGCRITGTSRVE